MRKLRPASCTPLNLPNLSIIYVRLCGTNLIEYLRTTKTKMKSQIVGLKKKAKISSMYM
jgi:hypothetical protein